MDTLTNEEHTGEIDWKRVRILLIVGIVSAVISLAGNMILGWGRMNSYAAGLELMFNKYRGISTGRIVLSSVLGLAGMTGSGICCFAVYRLIAPGSSSQASAYKAGIFGIIALGGAGVHLPYCAAVYVYNHMYEIEAETALWEALQYAVYFMLPAFGLFLVFYGILICVQAWAFWKESTPYPKWCAVFTPFISVFVLLIMKMLGGAPLFEALADGWLSIGFIWTFAGLLAMSRKAESGNF